MSKKKKYEDDEDLDNFDEMEDQIPDLEEEVEEDLNNDISEDSIISDDGDNLDIVIEISEEETENNEVEEDVVLSKHKVQGKHSLKYDSIFKGKKEEKLSEEDFYLTVM